jgi:hypothetical protein
MLNFGGMLKTTVDNGAEAFRFEDEVFETGCVDSYIMTPDDVGEGIVEME